MEFKYNLKQKRVKQAWVKAIDKVQQFILKNYTGAYIKPKELTKKNFIRSKKKLGSFQNKVSCIRAFEKNLIFFYDPSTSNVVCIKDNLNVY